MKSSFYLLVTISSLAIISKRELSDDEVIEYCLSCDESQLLGDGKYGNRVIRISDTQVVKFGRVIL